MYFRLLLKVTTPSCNSLRGHVPNKHRAMAVALEAIVKWDLRPHCVNEEKPYEYYHVTPIIIVIVLTLYSFPIHTPESIASLFSTTDNLTEPMEINGIYLYQTQIDNVERGKGHSRPHIPSRQTFVLILWTDWTYIPVRIWKYDTITFNSILWTEINSSLFSQMSLDNGVIHIRSIIFDANCSLLADKH